MSSADVHPIEEESYRIMRSRVDFSRWPSGAKQIVERMVHATADESFSETALVGDRLVASALGALRSGAPVVCDSRMVVAGVATVAGRSPVDCYLDRVPRAGAGTTRSAEAVQLAAAEHPDGALWVFGNAPTALHRLLQLYDNGALSPSAVIGLPVGYVGASEAKAALWASPLGAISLTNTGRRGGSPVAAAALNALARLAGSQTAPR